MDKIFVYDNFFNEPELIKIKNIIKSKDWKWGHTSANRFDSNVFWTMNLINEDYFNDYLKKVLEKHFSKKFNILRVYANGQTFGQDGGFHTDSEDPTHYTVCLYLTKIDKEIVDTAGGYITFKIPDEKFNLSFEPLYNRVIMFPSNYIHKGSAFSRFFTDIRICVAWKLQEIN